MPADQDPWPRPNYKPLAHDPVFLFILTPPYSGSTLLARILNTASHSMVLTRNGEGRHLVPGMRDDFGREPEYDYDWESIKATWYQQIGMVEQLTGHVEVVIDKSPTHLARAEQLRQHFPRSVFFAFNRNPYANCSSILYRRRNPENMTPEERLHTLTDIARHWISRSQYIRKWVETWDLLFFSYEAFCADPQGHVEKIQTLCPQLTGVDATKPVKIKDYPLQGIIDQNERQIGRLSEEDQSSIRKQLLEHEDLLTFFGYNA